MSALALAAVVLLAAAPRPLAEVWPYQVKTDAEGTIVYSYDLLPAKKAKGTADAVSTHGQEAVDAFLKGLPTEVKVKVPQGPGWTLSAGRGPEQRPLATAFALTADGPMQSDAALPQDVQAKLRAALHPDVPKVMVGAAALVWSLRQLEDGVVAAAALDAEPARRDLFQKVQDKALARAKGTDGDAKEGAQRLAARIAAAESCLDVKRLSGAMKADEALSKLATAEVERLAAQPDALVAPPPFTWTPELTCVWIRWHALAAPFDVSRSGSVAALTFLDLVKGDAKLSAELERLTRRSTRFIGPPAEARLSKWLEAAKGKPAEAVDALSEFLDGLALNERTPPGLYPLPASPFRKFLDELSPQERAVEFDELATAAQDGRLSAALASEEWPASRDATLAALASADTDTSVQLDGSWREQLGADFAMAQLAHHEARSGGRDLVADDEEKSGLAVRLMVPPALEVEPVPLVFARAHAALSRLSKALGEEKLSGLRAVTPEGGRSGEGAASEADRLASVFRGLERLASPRGARTPDADLSAARRFLAGWRNDARLSRDVRMAAASTHADKDQRAHAALVGVTRRELVVGFAAKPQAELIGGGKGFELFTDAEQRYVVPVPVTVSAVVSATKKPLDRAALKAAIDGVGRDPVKVEAAFGEALNK